jgi:trk system potassium uptake protein TrkA
VVIIGGTPIGVAVAEYMLAQGRSVVVVDKDYDHCVQLTEILSGATILNGDISDHAIYDDSDIKNMDAIITTTGNDELNIIGGVYAKALGVKKAVAVVEKTSYLTVAASIGIDSTVSPRFTAVNSILKLVRKGNVRSIHSLFDGQAEAIEVKLLKTSSLLNIPLKDLKLPPDCRVVAVDRDKKTIIPHGGLELQMNDRVVFFAKRASIAELEKMLA